jgi:putative transposase
MILTSKISLSEANTNKLVMVDDFIAEYRKAVEFYVDYIWDTYGIDKQKYDNLPKYLHGKAKPPETKLSARALKCASNQAIGMVKSRVKKLAKTQYVVKQAQKSGKPLSKLQSRYDRLVFKLKKPRTNNIYPELNSICCKWEQRTKTTKTKSFDGMLVLSSIGEEYGKIIIPVKKTKHFNDLASLGMQLNSFILMKDYVHVRFEITVNEKETGTTEGADQGISTCVTLSDGQTTKVDCHGHSLHTIVTKIAKKKKGSKAFARAQAHRTNYINWSIKQLNLTDIKQINLEKLRYLGKNQKQSRFLQAFTYKDIRTAMEKTAYLHGVLVSEQENAFRSQRCNHCGFVHKSSRRNKMFKCKSCGFTCDADLNAAMNHRDRLVPIKAGMRRQLPNRTTGFYWTRTGLFDADGLELAVPIDYNRLV